MRHQFAKEIENSEYPELHGNTIGCQTYHYLWVANKEYPSYHLVEYEVG